MPEMILAKAREKREQLFLSLYKGVFPDVARYVSKMGGTLDDAKDIFQDALVIYYEKLQEDSLTIRSNERYYLTGVARHLWIKRYKEKARIDSLQDDFEIPEENEGTPSPKILAFLESAGKKCMEMLEAFYYHRLPLDQIAQHFGFSGVRSATVQKFKCLEKIRNTIKEKTLIYEDFIERD